MDLTPFERAVLENLVKGDPEEEVLREQLKLAQVSSRDHTGLGVFVKLCIPESAPHTRMTNRLLESTPMAHLRHPELTDGGMALLWFVEAHMSTLEFKASEGRWPMDESKFQIENHGFPDMRRG